jgi:hypothetical protein
MMDDVSSKTWLMINIVVFDRPIVSALTKTAAAGCCGNFCSGHPLDSKLSEGSGGGEIVSQRKEKLKYFV